MKTLNLFNCGLSREAAIHNKIKASMKIAAVAAGIAAVIAIAPFFGGNASADQNHTPLFYGVNGNVLSLSNTSSAVTPSQCQGASYNGQATEWALPINKNNIEAVKVVTNNGQKVNLDSFKNLFNNLPTCKEIDVTNVEFNQTKSMKDAFKGDAAVEIIKFNEQNPGFGLLEDMSGMFEGCESLTTIVGLPNLNTANCHSFCNTFKNCKSIKEIIIPNWNSNQAWTFDSMFEGCEKLEKVNINNLMVVNTIESWDQTGKKTETNTSINNMFKDCSSLYQIIKGQNWGDYTPNGQNAKPWVCKDMTTEMGSGLTWYVKQKDSNAIGQNVKSIRSAGNYVRADHKDLLNK